tara:strand:+ start:672 stop:1886 length:1215 start_codon:yes stop_codon:yes gene_type:complete
MNYIIFEDLKSNNLKPFSLNHASFEMRCGLHSNIERINNIIDSEDKLYLIVRTDIEDLIREKFNNCIVNPKLIPKGLFLNGATIWNRDLINKLELGKSYSNKGSLIAINSINSTSLEQFHKLLEDSIQITLDINVIHINYIWDLIFNIDDIIKHDLNNSDDFIAISNIDMSNQLEKFHHSVITNNSKNIFISDGVEVGAGSVLDASDGPIVIDKYSKIDIGALIKGPIYIGQNSVINPGAKLRGNISIGPICKIGGELEDVVIQGYTNKQHDGYLGHSFLGEWINLGANTNNSDLKNNYSNIRMKISKDLEINTLRQFLGSCIGDYTRTGISTMLNSGTVIGLGANVFGSDFQDKYIESFQWGREDKTDFQKFIETCAKMKERRNSKFSKIEIQLLKQVYDSID